MTFEKQKCDVCGETNIHYKYGCLTCNRKKQYPIIIDDREGSGKKIIIGYITNCNYEFYDKFAAGLLDMSMSYAIINGLICPVEFTIQPKLIIDHRNCLDKAKVRKTIENSIPYKITCKACIEGKDHYCDDEQPRLTIEEFKERLLKELGI